MLCRRSLVSHGQEQVPPREVDAQHRRLLRSEGGQKKRLRIRLNGRIVSHVDLLEICVGCELIEVPERNAAIVGGRGQDVVVATEEEGGDHACVVAEVAEQVTVCDVPQLKIKIFR